MPPATVDEPVVTRARPLTLQLALAQAANQSVTLARGAEAVNKASAGLVAANNAFLPQVNLSAQVARYGNKQNQAMLVGSSVIPSEAAFYSSYAALSASINLYSGGASRAGYQAASAELDAAREDYEYLRVRQFVQVLDEYAALAKAQGEYLSLRRQESLYAAQTELAAAAFHRGQASLLDVNAVRQQLSQRRSQAVQQLAALEDRADQLAVSLGLELPDGERLMAVDSLPLPPELPGAATPAPADIDSAEHPALRAAQLRLEVAQNRVEVARAAFLPKVDLVGDYQWVGRNHGSAGGSIDALRANSYTVGFALRQSLVPFAQENAALQSAQAELREAMVQLREVRLRLWHAKRQALAEVARARAALALARQSENDAQEAVFLHQARLRHGRGSERALVEMEANMVQRQLERLFHEINSRLVGWAAYALIAPRRYAATLLDGVRQASLTYPFRPQFGAEAEPSPAGPLRLETVMPAGRRRI